MILLLKCIESQEERYYHVRHTERHADRSTTRKHRTAENDAEWVTIYNANKLVQQG